ncbi:MAG: hypothetical protein HYV63_29255 [Candidatus Schekmanbacteria bacterium]|nr:hypothetical protein [Candidatus Schekmanbacteria bacterium]
MSYSDFTLSDLKEKFNLTIEEEIHLFPDATDVQPSELLNETLIENIPLALAIHTEKARSELIITPVLVELRRKLRHRISLFSGISFDVDKELGLTGTCDYLISLSKEQLYVSSPIISVVEAKNDNIKAGFPQCAAEMIAARLFNERKGNPISQVYGVVTNGSNWRFVKLSDILYIDLKEYYIERVAGILGILSHIVCQAEPSGRIELSE